MSLEAHSIGQYEGMCKVFPFKIKIKNKNENYVLNRKIMVIIKKKKNICCKVNRSRKNVWVRCLNLILFKNISTRNLNKLFEDQC